MSKFLSSGGLKVNIDNGTVVRVLTLVIVFVLGLAFFWLTRGVVILLVVAGFLAIALSPLVHTFARYMPRNSRVLATLATYLIVLSVVGVLAFSLVPPLVSQGRDLVRNLPTYIDNLQTSNSALARFARKNGIADELTKSKDRIVNTITKSESPLFNVLKRITSSVVAALTVLVLTFMMLVEGPRLLEGFWSLQPEDKETHRKHIGKQIYKVITAFVNGQLVVAFLLAIFDFIMLTVLHVPYALPLAAVAGLLGLIPLIGHPIGALLLVIVCLFSSVGTAIVMLIAVTLYLQFENYLIHPMIQSHKVDVSPLGVFVAVLFGVTVSGVLGALLAIPVAATIKILINDYVKRHRLRHAD